MDRDINNPCTLKISLPWQWRPVKRHMLPGCELFSDGDAALHTARKLVPLDVDEDEDNVIMEKENIPCGVVGCKQTFTSLMSYENHYNSVHRHSCITCHRNFPSSYLLEIHIQENHDPLFSILASRQNMYQCLVESCYEKFLTPDDRRQHLIKSHHYPSNFRFHRLRPTPTKSQKPKGQADTDKMEIDMASQATREDTKEATHAAKDTCICPRSPVLEVSTVESSSDKENSASADIVQLPEKQDDEAASSEMDVCEPGKASAPRRVFVHKVPQNFSFGHGASRGFHRPHGKRGKKRGAHWHQRSAGEAGETTTNIETVNMKDMADALSDAL